VLGVDQRRTVELRGTAERWRVARGEHDAPADDRRRWRGELDRERAVCDAGHQHERNEHECGDKEVLLPHRRRIERLGAGPLLDRLILVSRAH